jgi:N-acyl-D-aspartate/D-glutamate deacylase
MPVPSRASTDSELLALCEVVADHPGTVLGFSPDQLFGTDFEDDLRELLVQMSLAANRPLFINGPERGKLAAADDAARRGARVVPMTLPHGNPLRLTLFNGLVWDSIPGWAEVMHLSHGEKLSALADPSCRAMLRAAAQNVPHMKYTRFAETHVYDVESPTLAHLVGCTVGDIARERGHDPFEVLLDIALADDLRTGFMSPTDDQDRETWVHRVQMLTDARTVMSGTDAGAHLDMVQAFDCITQLVGPVRRRFGLITLEEAVRQATDVPARLYGLRGRGRIATGWIADLVVFDPDRIDSTPATRRYDLPGGAWRLTSGAKGLHFVFVNGVLTLVDDQFTGDTPGTVLRSGKHTDTVPPRS